MQRVPLAIRVLLLAAIYYAAAKLGLVLAYVNASTTAVWPPTGIALAALLLFGTSMWPGVAIGAFVANIATSKMLMAAGIATGNTLEAVVAAVLIRRFAGGVDALRRTPGLFQFLFFAALASTVSATIGVATLEAGGAATRGAASAVWLTWWLGDLLGAIVYTPLVVYWVLPSEQRWTAARGAEFALVFGAAVAVAVLVFGGVISFAAIRPIASFSFPIVVWAALRFSQREAVTCAFAYSTIAVWGTIHGHGPYAGTAPNQALLLVQTFAGILTMTGCEVAALATEHRRLRGELEQRVVERTEQRREAEELSRLKDEFLAMMSHELRTPLNAVLGWAHLLSTAPYDAERTAKGLRVIQRNAQIQTRLIEDLLDVSEFIAGRTRLDRRAINLTPIVASAADAVGVTAAKKQIKISVSAPEQILVDGDSQRLQQVVVNLIGNAVKFTPDEGRVDVAIDRAGRDVQLRVSDTGRGIDPEFLPHVFDPFWQGDARKHSGGLGLGLTIVRLIVEAHEGSVRAESAGPGKGATFVVRLPGVTSADAAAGT